MFDNCLLYSFTIPQANGGFSLQSVWFNPWWLYSRFMVDKVTQEQVFILVSSVSSCWSLFTYCLIAHLSQTPQRCNSPDQTAHHCILVISVWVFVLVLGWSQSIEVKLAVVYLIYLKLGRRPCLEIDFYYTGIFYLLSFWRFYRMIDHKCNEDIQEKIE